MYNTTNVVNYGRGYGGCGCHHYEVNGYAFPTPLRKEQKRLDAVQLTIHTDEIIRRECVKGPCCRPEPVIVKDEKKSFIISAATNCLEPGTYYTLQIDRETPFEAFGYDTYINVEPCGFFRGEVGLNWTKMEHFFNGFRKDGKNPILGGDHEKLEGLGAEGFDGQEGFDGFDGDGFVDGAGFDGADGFEGGLGCAGIPADPAFPAERLIGFKSRSGKGILVPVTLDLHGNIATGKNFATGRYTMPGIGRPYNNLFTLFYNNRGEFVLSRNWRRRSDYA